MSAPKKRKLDFQTTNGDHLPDPLLSDVQAEVGLEIAIRQRLIDTLESRITWALILQESTQQVNRNAAPETFRNVALDALSVVDGPSNQIISHDPLPPIASRVARPPPRKSFSLSNVKSKPSFLYIRSTNLLKPEDTTPNNHVYLLKCPQCSRTSFTSLQGLLNHARLTHNLEWGTHDECIRACAVIDNDLDVACGIEVGLGPMGVLPGLRTIFQMAVGAHYPGEKEANGSDQTCNTTELPNQPSTTSYLNQTLGLHEDSPALAPFLGKEPIRRQIKVVDEGINIDIESIDGSTSPRKLRLRRSWRMPFTQRNFTHNVSSEFERGVEKGLENEIPINRTPADPTIPSSQTSSNQVSALSRFHLVSRIIIADRSLWIPAEQRLPDVGNYTHKWMISVDSPSYSHHITTILNNVKVIPSDSSLSIPPTPIATKPPFVVVGVSDTPFLARVELSFSGTPTQQSQKLVFEHWVDLDLLQSGHPALGDEQVVDIDLDKNTILKPPQLLYAPIGDRSLWNQAYSPKLEQDVPLKTEAVVHDPLIPSEEYEKILAKIVKSFPMTIKDIKGTRSHNLTLPYMLVPTPEYFRSLVVGRRKAIEWGRARAIQNAYNHDIHNSANQDLIPLTVADVYAWMSEHGHFLEVLDQIDKPRMKQEFSEICDMKDTTRHVYARTEEKSPRWCRVCGLEARIHPNSNNIIKVDPEDQKAAGEGHVSGVSILTPVTDCQLVPKELHIAKLPRLDIHRLMPGGLPQLQARSGAGSVALNCRSLLCTAEPRLTSSIHRLVESWGLSKFRHPVDSAGRSCSRVSSLDELGEHRKDVEKNLAPHALLAHITEQFVRALISRGLEVSNRDKAIFMGTHSASKGTRRRAEKESKLTRMLTPTHILSGILTRGQGRGISQDPLDVLSCLSKLGVAVDSDSLTPSHQGETGIRVKLEDENVVV